ncbi:hypothetical protein PSEEN5272 [Pseudomonas entomophila L48]|uniref:Uncharacterized protein n=1 Tax=Pseudomonas entomophila (strain L48) TaxID=384676 RepID=Q1I390_PSEE4|nr:hypothetical protein PSEEN5272 [Pseudomonas entomophila L48]
MVASIEKGKVRGYDEVRDIDGGSYFFQYAIKKQGEKYVAYFFCVLESKMDVFEDYATEELSEFSSVEEAFDYFRLKNVDVGRFSSMKGVLPF